MLDWLQTRKRGQKKIELLVCQAEIEAINQLMFYLTWPDIWMLYSLQKSEFIIIYKHYYFPQYIRIIKMLPRSNQRTLNLENEHSLLMWWRLAWSQVLYWLNVKSSNQVLLPCPSKSFALHLIQYSGNISQNPPLACDAAVNSLYCTSN